MMELASRHVTMSFSKNSIRSHRLVCTGLIANLFEDTTKPDQFNDLLPVGNLGTRLGATTAATTAAAVNPTSMDLDLPVDPNEPTYCFCNQVSYGEMVACDNPSCKIEWFHYGCVGLNQQPKGKWYCSECVGMQKRKKGK